MEGQKTSVVPLSQNSVVNSGQFCKASISGLASSDNIKWLGDGIHRVGRGHIRIACRPAITAMKPPKVIRLKRHTSWTLQEVTRAEIAPHSSGDQEQLTRAKETPHAATPKGMPSCNNPISGN